MVVPAVLRRGSAVSKWQRLLSPALRSVRSPPPPGIARPLARNPTTVSGGAGPRPPPPPARAWTAPSRAHRGPVAAGVRWLSSDPFSTAGQDLVLMKDQRLQCVIGCNEDERDRLQELIINVQLWTDLRASMGKYIQQYDILEVQKARADAPDWAEHAGGELKGTVNYSSIGRISRRICEEGKFFTIEALAQCIARAIILECDAAKVQVSIDKPEAMRSKSAYAAGCQVTRSREDFIFANPAHPGAPPRQSSAPLPPKGATGLQQPQPQPQMQPTVQTEPHQRFGHIAYLALGSNVGHRATNIQRALRLLTGPEEPVQLLATSFLYESPAAYVTNQPPFTNAACKVSTSLGPDELLKRVKEVEEEVGREHRYRWGPREVDVDIILYDSIVHHAPNMSLQIPHIRAHERDFVLGPLCDIQPSAFHPDRNATSCELLQGLLESLKAESCALTRVLPVPMGGKVDDEGGEEYLKMHGEGAKTAVMGILNYTPDSFSDGGVHSASVEDAVKRIQEMVAEGADIIDIGGQSTRPDAEINPEEEELRRVVPVIKAAREAGVTQCISVDTFRANVARKAIEAGATMINDVTGGLMDPEMLPTAADLQVPICLMHYRGDPSTMVGLANYPPGDVMGQVARELTERTAAALRAGVHRWNIILDPGIGFAKTASHSLDTLRGSRSLTRLCRPWSGCGSDGYQVPGLPSEGFGLLIGASRKSFIGTVLKEKDAKSTRRVWGTAAASTAGVEQGACIVRVHDVAEMADVLKLADAIYRW